MKFVTQHTAVTVSDTIIRFTSILMKGVRPRVVIPTTHHNTTATK